MQNKYNIVIFLIFIFLNSCQAGLEGLTGQRKSSGEEFLVKKKNPLSMPPDFNKLPKPMTESKDIAKTEEIDVQAILGSENDQSIKKSTSPSSVEESILDKIN